MDFQNLYNAGFGYHGNQAAIQREYVWQTDIRRLTKELRKDFENPYYCLLVWNHKDRHGVKSRLHPVIIMQNYVR